MCNENNDNQFSMMELWIGVFEEKAELRMCTASVLIITDNYNKDKTCNCKNGPLWQLYSINLWHVMFLGTIAPTSLSLF